MSVTATVAAPTAQAAPSGLEALMSELPLMIIIFALFYFLILRPQQKRMKDQKALIDSAGKGDEVVTTGGVLGRITKANEQYVTLEIADGVEVVIQRAAISAKLEKGTIKSAR